MDWQWVIVTAALAAAVGYVLWSAWQTWFGTKPGCASSCGGCAKPPAGGEPDARRIELPRV